MRKKQCVAMLLAGGQGSRLYALTSNVAKPAVSFGSKYRIIDFPLSNCINSGIDTVGVLTQYQPLELNDYIGNGEPWDLDRTWGGVHVLPPYQRSRGGDWYRGTANAIYQNMGFIDRYDPDYVLVLSGDHIYKMDYDKMLDFHKKNNADCTIAVIEVTLQEAKRFGIMNTDENNRIYEFEEKPAKPKSTKASMGVYIFNKDVLFEYLKADEEDKKSSKDFGKNIIPAMLRDDKRMFAYGFTGYWKDVGTIDSLWEANMDLLGEKPVLDLNDPAWKIYYRHTPENPHYIGADAKVKNSALAEGCEIDGTIENSVLFTNITVEKGAVVRDSVIMGDCVIKAGARVEYAILDSGVVVGENARVGVSRQDASGIAVIGANVEVGAKTVVDAGEMITEDVK